MTHDAIISESCVHQSHVMSTQERGQLTPEPRVVTREGWLVAATQPIRANVLRYQALRVHPVQGHLTHMSRAVLAQARA